MLNGIAGVAKLSVSLRLIVALLFGLQFGLLAFFHMPSLAWSWVPWLPLVILLVAVGASIWSDPRVRGHKVEAEQVLQGLVRFLLVMILPVFLAIVTFFFIRSVFALILALIPLGLGVITAFTVMGKRRPGLAVLCGLLAWLGVGVPFLLSTYLTSRQPGNDIDMLAFITLTSGVVMGFAFAGLGGFLGRLLRVWVLG
jgi:uncharacterized membrane protein